MGKIVRLVGGAALVILGCLLGIAFIVMAAVALRGIIPQSLSYLAAPLLFLVIRSIHINWPKWREQLRQRSAIAKLQMIGKSKPYGAPPDDFGFVKMAMERAAQLPLLDAAFHLWTDKHQLDDYEGFLPPRNNPPNELADNKVFGKVVREAIHTVHLDRENAHFGTTLLRLENLHPKVSRKVLQQAIKAAVKLDVDCLRNFTYTSQNYFDDVTRAVVLSKLANPGFLEATYQAAGNKLAQAMR